MAATENNVAGEPTDLISQADAARLRKVTRSAIGYLVTEKRIGVYERYVMPLVSEAEVLAYEPLKPGPKPKGEQRDEEAREERRGEAMTTDHKAKKKAVARWENEGGAVLPKAKGAPASKGSIATQTKTTRRLDQSVKQDADARMAGVKKGGRK